MRFVNQYFQSTIQKEPEKVFITVWKTDNAGTSLSNQITLPLVATTPAVNMVVDWGDGTTDVITSHLSPARTHTFPTAGIYEVKMTGLNVTGFSFNNLNDRLKLLEIKSWGAYINRTVSSFFGCSNLVISATDSLKFIGLASQAFRACTLVTGNSGFQTWDLSECTGTGSMFLGSGINCPLPNWNLSNCISVASMFSGSPFNNDVTNWILPNNGVIAEIFRSASAFNHTSILTWDTSEIINFQGAFYLASAFNQPIGSWNVGNGVNFFQMFFTANVFNQPLNPWNMSKATDIRQMFYRAYAFNQPLSSWSFPLANSLSYLFAESAFNQDISMWNVAHVTSFEATFYFTPFNQPLNSWNVGNGTNFYRTFRQSAYNYPLNSWNMSSATTIAEMFYGNLTFNQDISSWNVSNVTTLDSTFYQAKAFNSPLNTWNTGNVTTLNLTFYDADAFNQPLNSWDVSKVTNLTNTFALTLLFNQPLNSWNVSLVTQFNSTFYGATAFNQPLNSWNVGNGVNFFRMFRQTPFNHPLNSWDMSKATNISEMFFGNTVFNQDLSAWNISLVTTINSTFSGASAFNQSLAGWNPINVTNALSFCFNTAMSMENYRLTLLSWKDKVLKPNVTIDFRNTRFLEGDHETARQQIITNYNWTILDAGVNLHFRFCYVYFTLYNRNKVYTGPCMRVRRASDNLSQDINFGVDNWVNEAQIASFCGASEGFIDRLYKCNEGNSTFVQAANVIPAYMEQLTLALQPKIYDGTQVIKSPVTGKPVIRFTGTESLATPIFNDTNSSPARNPQLKAFIVARPTSADQENPICHVRRTSRNYGHCYYVPTSATIRRGHLFNHTGGATTDPALTTDFIAANTVGDMMQLCARRAGGNTRFELYKGNVYQDQQTYPSVSFGAQATSIGIGNQGTVAGNFVGDFHEWIHHGDSFYGEDFAHFDMIAAEQRTAYGL